MDTLAERVLGRSAAIEIVDPLTSEALVPAGTLIDEAIVETIDRAGIESVKIRSVLTCGSKGGVCASCYGRDLARGTRVNLGEAVGIMAAQSIGEPGTQLTMRTFHIGGAAQRGAEQSSVEAVFDATVTIRKSQCRHRQRGAPRGHGAQHRAGAGRRSGTANGRATECPTAPGFSPTRVP